MQAISRGEGAPAPVPRADVGPVERLARPQAALRPDRARRRLHSQVPDQRTGDIDERVTQLVNVTKFRNTGDISFCDYRIV